MLSQPHAGRQKILVDVQLLHDTAEDLGPDRRKRALKKATTSSTVKTNKQDDWRCARAPTARTDSPSRSQVLRCPIRIHSLFRLPPPELSTS